MPGPWAEAGGGLGRVWGQWAGSAATTAGAGAVRGADAAHRSPPHCARGRRCSSITTALGLLLSPSSASESSAQRPAQP